MENLLKSAYGTVRPYTRHATGCANQSDDNSCRCPKWLYVFTLATKEKRRYTLNTPSWAEAVREASDALRGLDPEIAASRAKAQDSAAPLTVREAMHLWVARTENKLGKNASTIVQYRHLEVLVSEWARANGIKYAKDITSYQLESWYASEEWTRLAPTTRKQRWAVLRVMFAHMVKMKAISQSPADPIEATTRYLRPCAGTLHRCTSESDPRACRVRSSVCYRQGSLRNAASRLHRGSCLTPVAMCQTHSSSGRIRSRKCG